MTLYSILKNIYIHSPASVQRAAIYVREYKGRNMSKKLVSNTNTSRDLCSATASKKNILFYHISGLSFAGTEKFLQILAKHLDKEKYNVYYMYSSKPRRTTGELRLDGRLSYLKDFVHLIEFDYSTMSDSYPYIVHDMNPSILEVIKTYSIDIVFSAGAGYAEFPLNIIKDIPIIMINIFGSANVQKNIVSNICISHEVERKIAHIVPESKRSVMYIQSEKPSASYVSLGASIRERFGINKDEIVFGRIGRPDDSIFDPIGINAFELLARERSDVHYIIMSPPPIVRNIVKERNIPKVHFIEPSSKEEDVWAFHYALDALAHFRLDGESFGLNIAESMIAGNPIVTHTSHIWNAHLEYLKPEFSFVSKKDDVLGYKNSLQAICKAKEDGSILRMREKSKEEGLRLFVIDNTIGQIEKIIDASVLKVSIFTRPGNIFFRGCISYYLKQIARKILRIRRGPDVVLQSLLRGLTEKGVDFNINPTPAQTHCIMHVISNPEAVTWAISQKKRHPSKKLIVGPNVTVLPSDNNRLLENPEIDTILVPSEWTKEAHALASPKIKNSIRIWPAGVSIPSESDIQTRKNKYILFVKDAPSELVEHVTKLLTTLTLPFDTLRYGTFTQKEYFEKLKAAKGMIYLQKVESQGIALQEAWSFNVPTLVWNKGHFKYPHTNIEVTGAISAPYLSPETGMFFSNIDDVEVKLREFVSHIDSFTPRTYCIDNLSDSVSADIYTKIITEHAPHN